MLRQAEVAKVERAQLGPPATQLSEQPCGAAGRCPARHGGVVSWLKMTSFRAVFGLMMNADLMFDAHLMRSKVLRWGGMVDDDIMQCSL